MAWYHPIPRLGAPHPTKTTSACPSLAKFKAEPAIPRFAVARNVDGRATKAAERAIAAENMMDDVNMSFIKCGVWSEVSVRCSA